MGSIKAGTPVGRTTAGQLKASGGVLWDVAYSDTAAGLIHIRDGGAGGTIIGTIRLAGAGTQQLVFPNGRVFNTDCYIDMSTVTSPNVSGSIE